MSYEYITKYDSPNYTEGRQGNKISEIVIHHWGIDGQSFNGVVNWLCRKNGNSSAHYVIEGGKVACLVDCADTAWHAGNFAHNLKSIGIECRPEMSAQDLETVCELVADLYEVYGVLPIVGHKDVSATSCPGRYYAKLSYIKKRAQEIMNGSKPSTPKPQPPKPSTGTKYKVDDTVNINGVYTSSSSTTKLKPAKTSGKITKIVAGAKNPYLLDNGNLGWVNDNCITGKKGTSTTKTLKVGMKAKPKKAVSYDGVKLASFLTTKYFKVIEIKGKRVVLGDGLNTAFNIDNLTY
ncbi:hypothetical protein A9CBEGH2_07760 [Amedibacterium intestinale]|uniref:N-acetylmuramoyl-L-alanine amidase n=1 Tax=Amedibacterium intestinale TaxID=2583452 RepID=UPI001373CFBA|nr:peptidoglycan recognition family protein [Amedibacterium intestinale]BBK61836.1 hypothetical protein A9CBEGH2_07760 [Amedibacterium intestinale]